MHYQTPAHSRRRSSTIIFASILVLYLCLALPTAKSLLPNADEPLFAIPAYYLASEGRMVNPVVEPTRPDYVGMDRYQFFMPPATFLEIALATRVFGLGVLAARLPSILWGLAAIIAIRRIAEEVTRSRAAALTAAALVAVDSAFLSAATNGRPDMACFASGVCGLAAYLSLRERSLALALMVANSLAVLGGLSHPNGVVATAILVAAILTYDRARLTPALVSIAMLPYLAGAFAWGGYIAQSPGLFQSQFLGNFTHVAGGRSPISNPWLSLLAECRQRYGPIYGLLPPYTVKSVLLAMPLAIYVAASAAMFASYVRQPRATRLLLIVVAVYVGFITFLTPQKRPYYLVYTVPWLAVITAVAFHKMVQKGSWWRLAALGFAAILLAANLAREAAWTRGNGYAKQYLPVARFVLDHSQPGDLIMGGREFFFALGGERHLLDDWWYGARTGRVADFVILERNENAVDSTGNSMSDASRFRAVRNQYEEAFSNSLYRVYARRGLQILPSSRIALPPPSKAPASALREQK